MWVCVHVSVCVMCLCVQVQAYVSTSVYTCVCAHASVFACRPVCVYVCVYMCVWMCVRICACKPTLGHQGLRQGALWAEAALADSRPASNQTKLESPQLDTPAESQSASSPPLCASAAPYGKRGVVKASCVSGRLQSHSVTDMSHVPWTPLAAPE